MKVTLVKTLPKQDGYYLVKFSDMGGLHLVLVQTMLDGKKQVISDICPFVASKPKAFKCMTRATELYFHEFPQNAWWSDGPLQIKLGA